MAPPPLNIPQVQKSTECDHPIALQITRDGSELRHYGVLLRDALMDGADAEQTPTGWAIVQVRRWHKEDEREEKRRAKQSDETQARYSR